MMINMWTLPSQPFLTSPNVLEVVTYAFDSGASNLCLEAAIDRMRAKNRYLRVAVMMKADARALKLTDQPEAVADSVKSAFRLGAYASYITLDTEKDGSLPELRPDAITFALRCPQPTASWDKEWHFAIERDEGLQTVAELAVPQAQVEGPLITDSLLSGAGLVSYLLNHNATRSN